MGLLGGSYRHGRHHRIGQHQFIREPYQLVELDQQAGRVAHHSRLDAVDVAHDRSLQGTKPRLGGAQDPLIGRLKRCQQGLYAAG